MAESLTSITGLSSGIDSKALVEQMMKLERRPADRLQAVVDANAKRSKALGQLQTKLDAVRSAAAGLVDGSAFEAMSVTTAGVASGGRSLLTATATAGATQGAYQIKVLSLATAQKSTSSIGQTSATTALGVTGTFELRRPDDTVLGTVTLDGTETLNGIRDKINTASGTAKIQASVVSANAAGTDQRLVLASQQTGSAGRFKLVATAGDPLTPLGLAAPIEQIGKDSQVDIDGVVVTRSTNTISDVLKGVTLNLTAEDPTATATMTVERFAASPREAVKAFVEAYNAARKLLGEQMAIGQPLANEPMARAVRGSMSKAILDKGTGLPADLATLASVGVSLNKDGTLAYDEAKFNTAYTGRFDELKATLANRAKAVSDFAESLSKPMTGVIAQRDLAITDHTLRLTDRIADIDARLEKKRAALLAHFAKFEATLGGITAMGNSLSSQLKGLTAKSED